MGQHKDKKEIEVEQLEQEWLGALQNEGKSPKTGPGSSQNTIRIKKNDTPSFLFKRQNATGKQKISKKKKTSIEKQRSELQHCSQQQPCNKNRVDDVA